ncbi:MAG: NAD(P)H-hydrate dehydratase [Acidiferrobacterales bacterium]
MRLPEALYYAEQTRQLDRVAIEGRGIGGYALMQRAGQAALMALRQRWPRAKRLAVVCGPGNNGGDGYVLARLACDAGLIPVVMALGDRARVRGDARTARDALEKVGVKVEGFAPVRVQESDVIVDALFGTGLEREVRNEWRAAIETLNALPQIPLLSIDIPSGLHADTGRVLDVAVRAQVTVTFIGLKTGLFTGEGPEYGGEVVFDDLQVPADIYSEVTPAAFRITERALTGILAPRPRMWHKGDAGHVAVIGGAEGMPGAARLAGEAAYRAGAGLVTLVTHQSHAAHINSNCPELLVHAASDARALRLAVRRANVLAIGPGLGQSSWGREMLTAVLDIPLPKVVDADALNLLAADPVKRSDWILTPHPGEAARLLDTTTNMVQAQRFEALHRLTERFGGVVVLKGAGTLISDGRDRVWLCDAGNPGMATGGMGDVLTGIVAALSAQDLKAIDAARVGVWVHAIAGDDAVVKNGEIGLMASDLMCFVRRRLNQLSTHEA